ncbi:MAG: right-handed parallel beta-helix repeat-containing protein, partial [Armatimonadota bacterium]
CDIHDVGRDAVSLDGGNFDTLEPAENYADNNYIHHTGVYYKQGVGVGCNGVGNRISHNLIHDCPRFGIAWGGSDHVFEYNEIRHCDLETADCGAIYSWQVDWSKRGTQIRYNYLHDIIGFGMENGKWTSPHMNWGVYLDDGTCGTHVYGNIVARTILGGVHYHGGRDNVVENNILIDGRDSQVQYSGYGKGLHPVPMMTDTWNKGHGTAAYLKYPGYEALTKSLEDAWEMSGNVFQRNIVSYREPTARLYAYYNLPFDKTISDYNTVWHYKQPILTGVTKLKSVTGPNLAPNPGFEEGEAGKEPPGWQWQVKPNDSAATLDADVKLAGKQSLRLDGKGTMTDSSGQVLCVNWVIAEIPLKPGQTYQLAASVRADQATSGSIQPQAYDPGKFFWAKGNGFTAGPEWKRVEMTFRFPAPGDPDWKEGMASIRIRIDVSQGKGTFWVDDVEVREAVAMSEWEAWQDLGLDKHSVIADPLFVDAARGNYRLKPNSPALKLGFKPIPVDKIGPYKDELRATWPLKEAVGAREQMKIDWSKH